MKLLILGDSPTRETGFSRVVANLAHRWRPHCERIDIWAINYAGWPHDLPYDIYPAAIGKDWASNEAMQTFLNRLMTGDYTHLWMIQDTFQLVRNGLPEALRLACQKKKIKSFLYFPVDAPLEKEWTKIIEAVDVPVAYTEYGKQEALKYLPAAYREHIRVLPHGVDTDVYHPLNLNLNLNPNLQTPKHPSTQIPKNPNTQIPNSEYRMALREKLFPGWLGPDDVLLLNVNANQHRKDPVRALEILAALNGARASCPQHVGEGGGLENPARSENSSRSGQDGRAPHFKLFLNMARNSGTQIDLDIAARQLGLERGQDWDDNNQAFTKGFARMPEEKLNLLYNAADLCISTSLGEGWGLSITEAIAAGCPVAVPNHTACREIMDKLRELGHANIFTLPLERDYVLNIWDNARLRRRVDVAKAAEEIAKHSTLNSDQSRAGIQRSTLTDGARRWLSWNRIAHEWMRLFKEIPNPKSQAPIEIDSPDESEEGKRGKGAEEKRSMGANPPFPSAPLPLCPSAPPPPLQFVAVMISCAGRDGIREQTLANLKATDWPGDVIVSMDTNTDERLQERQLKNARTALRMGVEAGAPFILFLEDDLQFNRHLYHNLVNWEPLRLAAAEKEQRGKGAEEPVPFSPSPLFSSAHQFTMGSLYNPNITVLTRNDAAHYFIADPNTIYGSQAYLFSRACAEYLIEHWDEVPGMQDIKASRLAARLGAPIYYHAPSLVQHVGRVSAWGGPYHYTVDYDAEFKTESIKPELINSES